MDAFQSDHLQIMDRQYGPYYSPALKGGSSQKKESGQAEPARLVLHKTFP